MVKEVLVADLTPKDAQEELARLAEVLAGANAAFCRFGVHRYGATYRKRNEWNDTAYIPIASAWKQRIGWNAIYGPMVGSGRVVTCKNNVYLVA